MSDNASVLPPRLTISSMRALLDANGVHLTKSLGQNFLHDHNLVRKIVAAAGVGPGSRVLEIGPGLGPLTEHLLAEGARVLAVEKDRRLAHLLAERLGIAAGFDLVEADALAWLVGQPRDWTEWRVVSNLPYSVASPLMVELACAPRPPALIQATVQSEVARRLGAEPDTPEYGVLTALVSRQFEFCGQFAVPSSCFYPEPNVASACVQLVRRAAPLCPGGLAETYARAVKTAFGQRRKVIGKVLRSVWPDAVVSEALDRAGIEPGSRAGTVSPVAFARLAAALSAPGADRTGRPD